MKTGSGKAVVLGLGNPILTDDGAGCRVAAALKTRIDNAEADILEVSIAGLDFLELLVGYDKAIIIDAIQTNNGTPGQIYRLESDMLANSRHAGSPHDINLATALELGKKLGLPLPEQITLFAIEAKNVVSFGEQCTPEVDKAISTCVEMVVEELRGNGSVHSDDAAFESNILS